MGAIPLESHRSPPRLGGMYDDARRIFAAYDRDGSGFVDGSELRVALRDLGIDADSNQTASLIAK